MFAKNRMRQRRIGSLVAHFKDMKHNEEITHEELAKIVGLPICPYDLFHQALKKANMESGVYLDNIRGKGYVRIHPREWDGVSDKFRKRGRNQFRTGRKFVTNIVGKTNELDDEEQRRASRDIGLFQTIEAMSRRIK